MTSGVNPTPGQAAQSLRIVRLVSFAASALLAALVLLGIAALRYAPFTQDDAPTIVVIAELQPPPPPAPEPEARRTPPPEEAPHQTPAPRSEPAPPEQSAASEAPREPVLITDPVWVERPRNLARFYPRAAFMRGLSGQVVLDCIVETSGQLACTITSETPEAQGFGEAALAIASAHVMRPATENGAPVRGRYRMTVPFTAG